MPAYLNNMRDAAGMLRKAERVMVIGCSGGGKSTLSRKLCDRLDIPYVSMDREFYWLPGWVKREKAEERALIAETVARERWLMDGSGSSTFDLRLPRAQMMVWVRLPRWRCLLGEFLSYIWNFEKRFVPHILAQLQRYGAEVPVLQLKNHAEMRRLLDLLDAPA